MQKLPLALLACALASSAFAAPNPKSQSWEQCVQNVPASVESEYGKAGVEEWIAEHCGSKRSASKGLRQNDCAQLFAVMRKCTTEGSPDGLFGMGNATRESVQELLGQKMGDAFDADCIKAGQSKKAPNKIAFQKKYCAAK